MLRAGDGPDLPALCHPPWVQRVHDLESDHLSGNRWLANPFPSASAPG